MKIFKKLVISVLLLSFGAMFMNDVMAYTHEVRESGSSYVWRVDNVDQGTTSNLAVAIMNTMGVNREIDILVSGTITQTINVSASGVKLRFHGNTLNCNFTGSGIINNGHNKFEISDLTLRNVVGGYGIRSSAASDLRFVNVKTIDIDWIGIRIDSRTSNPWNHTIYDLYMKDIHVENCGSHGLETYSIDGMIIEGTITARNTGGCGVLFNQTHNGTVATVDAYNCSWGQGYAGLRYANACNNIITNKLKADRCGRGFFIVQSGPTVNCHLNNAEIYECSDIGIWIENGTNCSVKAGCSESSVSVSGSGSYADVSRRCDSECIPTSITPNARVNDGSWQEISDVTVIQGDEVEFGPHPVSGGSWSWSGPDGFSANTRTVTITSIQANQSGEYVATYTNTCGAQSTSTMTVTVKPPVSVSHALLANEENAILEGNTLRLAASNGSNCSVSFYDLRGKMIRKENLGSGIHSITLNSFAPKGTFILRVKNGNRTIINKRINITTIPWLL